MRMLSRRNKSRSREETGSEKYWLTCLRSCSPSVKEPRVAPDSHCAILPPSGVSEAKCRAWLSVGSHARSLTILAKGETEQALHQAKTPRQTSLGSRVNAKQQACISPRGSEILSQAFPAIIKSIILMKCS